MNDEPKPRFEIGALSPAASTEQWVTLVRCGTLMEADLLRSYLESEGINIFIPDENLMSNSGWGLNEFRFVRLQVMPKNYEQARTMLCASGDAIAV